MSNSDTNNQNETSSEPTGTNNAPIVNTIDQATENSATTALQSQDQLQTIETQPITLTISGTLFGEKKELKYPTSNNSKLRNLLKEAGVEKPNEYVFRDAAGKPVGLDRVITSSMEISSVDKTDAG